MPLTEEYSSQTSILAEHQKRLVQLKKFPKSELQRLLSELQREQNYRNVKGLPTPSRNNWESAVITSLLDPE